MAEPAATTAPAAVIGPLGRRLVAAFSAVTLVTVVLLAVAAQQAVDRGFAATRDDGLGPLAVQVADRAAQAYERAEGWLGADLTAAVDAAEEAGARLTIWDTDGTVVAESGLSGGPGMHSGGTVATVVVDGEAVGTVSVGAGGGSAASAQERGRQVAWSWIAVAAVVSLVLAVLAAFLLTRWLTAPLQALAAVARAFARGERGVRAPVGGTGELGALAAGFNEAADAVERSAQARRQMAADVAHELRTPLGALQAELEELRDGLAVPDRPTIARLHAQAVRLGRVVADLGVLAGADDPVDAPRAGTCDLAHVVAGELAARAAELRSAGIAVAATAGAPSTEIRVRADADRMHQVVGNLLANCARHCRPGDTLAVTLEPADGAVLLVVADDGPGIHPDDLPHVLDRYRRGREAPAAGSGLGLAVVREIVVGYGGTVAVESPWPTGGTRVSVTLPAPAP